MPDNYPGGDTCQTPGCSQPQEFHFNGFLFFFFFFFLKIKRVKSWLSLSLGLGVKESSPFLKACPYQGPSHRPSTLALEEGLRITTVFVLESGCGCGMGWVEGGAPGFSSLLATWRHTHHHHHHQHCGSTFENGKPKLQSPSGTQAGAGREGSPVVSCWDSATHPEGRGRNTVSPSCLAPLPCPDACQFQS